MLRLLSLKRTNYRQLDNSSSCQRRVTFFKSENMFDRFIRRLLQYKTLFDKISLFPELLQSCKNTFDQMCFWHRGIHARQSIEAGGVLRNQLRNFSIKSTFKISCVHELI